MPRARLLAAPLPLLVGAALLLSAATPQPTTASGVAVTSDSSALRGQDGPAADAAVARAAAADQALSVVDAAAAAAGGTISVVVLAEDGSTLVASASASRPVYSASLVKLLVVQQILATSDPSPADLTLLRNAIETSDDDAMNSLWVAYDGAALVAAAAEEFGLTGTAAPTQPGQWGQTTTTATDYARVLAGYADHLSSTDAASLTAWLQGTTATAADGFDQTFGVVTAEGTGTAAKQGWMCCVSDTRYLHSAGVLADGRVVVLLGEFPSSTSWDAARTAVDTAASAVAAA